LSNLAIHDDAHTMHGEGFRSPGTLCAADGLFLNINAHIVVEDNIRRILKINTGTIIDGVQKEDLNVAVMELINFLEACGNGSVDFGIRDILLLEMKLKRREGRIVGGENDKLPVWFIRDDIHDGIHFIQATLFHRRFGRRRAGGILAFLSQIDQFTGINLSPTHWTPPLLIIDGPRTKPRKNTFSAEYLITCRFHHRLVHRTEADRTLDRINILASFSDNFQSIIDVSDFTLIRFNL
jgi:hypothetical protein